jgi:hypothetical protein
MTTYSQKNPAISRFDLPAWLSQAWRFNPLLTCSIGLGLGLTVIALAGMLLDPRMLLNMPIWSKTLKFAISTTLYSASLLTMLRLITRRPGLVRFVGSATALIFLFELVVIAGQTVVRGVPAHFNIATPLDGALYSSMGVAINVLWGINVVGLILLLAERAAERDTLHAARLGLALGLVGAMLAVFMTMPTEPQLNALQAGWKVDLVGAHNVNVLADGTTRMIPVLGWNLDGGDLRIPHFVGLHGLQAIPLLGLVLRRRGFAIGRRLALLWIGAAGYLGVTLLTLWQALRNESIASPGIETLGALGAMAAILGIAALLTHRLR